MARIVLIEDTENNRVLIARRLREHEIVPAEDAEEGLQIVRDNPPDLILMDVGLPGMDGYDATRALKAEEATKRIPVIVLTAHAMAGDREKSLAAGADDYATKPIDFPELNAKIDALLGG
ncbi:MAG: response regulator [Limisphaerales bacterium]